MSEGREGRVHPRMHYSFVFPLFIFLSGAIFFTGRGGFLCFSLTVVGGPTMTGQAPGKRIYIETATVAALAAAEPLPWALARMQQDDMTTHTAKQSREVAKYILWQKVTSK